MVQLLDVSDHPGPSSTVLVVDDTAATRRMVAKTLEGLGFCVLLAADGVAAADLIEQCAPDAIVTDLEMPEMCGEELLALVRGSDDRRVRTLPILVISSNADASTAREVRRLGANAFVPKPVDMRLFAHTVLRVFRRLR